MWKCRVVVIGVMAACGDDGSNQQRDAAVDSPTGCVPGTQSISTVYLNFGGGTYMSGPDDATMKRASSLDMTRTLAAWPHANTAEIKACVEAALRPFRIAVTDVDPGGAPHHGIVMTNAYWGGNTGVKSIGPINCAGGPPNSLTFMFGDAIGTSARSACEYAMSQFGSATAALEHVTDCRDFLGADQPACGPRVWLNEPVTCGETTARSCACGSTHQISFLKMTQKFGASCAP